MKIHISPTLIQVTPDNGIGQVVIAQHKLLPAFGFEIVHDPAQAELIISHVTKNGLPRVDVLHSHGLHWMDVPHAPYGKMHHHINRAIALAAREAYALTVPAEWVAMPFLRDMRITPTVIGHGIDVDEWDIGENFGYILWNKNRRDDVCDPQPAFELAERGHNVVSTYAPKNKSSKFMSIIGSVSHDKMINYIQNADIYLATTLETFGIGTLEALASGVPVLGYDWGGTHDIVEHKVSGYLVRPGDIDGLEEGCKYIRAHRKKMSINARERSKQFTWDAAMEKYAKVYNSIVPEKPGVSIVIPSYNYAKYLPECLDSVLAQTEPADEVIVVNDGSTDNTTDVIEPYLDRIQYIRKKNGGVAAARNDGITKATQPYIVCLDADDKIAPTFVNTLKSALAHDRALGIAYSALQMFDDAGHIFNTDWPPEFEWEIQSAVSVPPSNCVPSGCMFRKSMWKKSGGIRQVYAPAEDAEFWVRGLSIGYNAKKCTNERLFIYRAHPDSASRTKQYKAIDMWHPWMRDKLYPFGAPGKSNPYVVSYVDPLVNVIIPVGPGHEKYLTGAIDSVLGQTFRNWILTVVNDTGKPLDMTVYPFVKVIDGERKGVSHARNLGIEACTTPLILFLDADDFLDPTTLDKMINLFEKSEGRYIYTDFMAMNADGTATAEECAEYDAKAMLEKALHGVTVLMDTADAKKVLFIPMEGWEDWEYFIRCATMGIHGKRLSDPLLYYRVDTGMRRKTSLDKKEALKLFIREKYADYITGEKSMGSCCGGSSAIPILQAKHAIAGEMMIEETIIDSGGSMVRMEYIGENTGAIWFNVDNRRYRGGNNAVNKFADVDPADVEYLIGTGRWKIIAQLKAEVKKEPVVPQKTEVETVAEARQIIEEARAEMVIMPEIIPDIEIEKSKEPVKATTRKTVPRKKK